MKYAGGEAFERMGSSRSSSWAIVTRMGAGVACADCCGSGTAARRWAGLLAASAFRDRNIARLARVNVFTKDAPGRRFISCTKLLVYAFAPLFSNACSEVVNAAAAAPAVRCV